MEVTGTIRFTLSEACTKAWLDDAPGARAHIRADLKTWLPIWWNPEIWAAEPGKAPYLLEAIPTKRPGSP